MTEEDRDLIRMFLKAIAKLSERVERIEKLFAIEPASEEKPTNG